MDTTELEILQMTLAKQVEVPKGEEGYIPKKGDIVFSFDVQYEKHGAYVAIDVLYWKEKQDAVYVTKLEEEAEYIPGFFAFREGPTLLKALEKMQEQHNITPNLIVVDGHGLAHPRKFGAACWLGIKTKIPTIGCAKRPLVKFDGRLNEERGSTFVVQLNDEIIGVALRTQTGIKPVYVSVGHKISLNNAIKVILEMSGKYRIIEPIRRADQGCRKFSRGEMEKGMVVLS